MCALGLAFLFKGIYSFVLPEESREFAPGTEEAEKMPEPEKENEDEEWQEIMSEQAEPIENKSKETSSEIKESAEGETETKDLEADIENEIEIKEFKTDKENYGSHEKVQFSVKIWSKKDIDEAEIKITGIQPYQRFYIDKAKITSLTAGENIFYIEAETPYCTSGCGGVYPGPYDVYASIFIGGKLIQSAENSINLVSR